jgi:hypothetical protein
MPFDSSPRSFARLIVTSPAARAHHRDRHLESGAHVRRAADDLQRFAPSVVTWHTDSFSASGWRRALEHFADDDAGERRRHRLIDSTSSPASVSCWRARPASRRAARELLQPG